VSCLVQCFHSIGGIAHNGQPGFVQQEPAQAFANRWGIVDDQDAKGSL
jgi:hypothetical protein